MLDAITCNDPIAGYWRSLYGIGRVVDVKWDAPRALYLRGTT